MSRPLQSKIYFRIPVQTLSSNFPFMNSYICWWHVKLTKGVQLSYNWSAFCCIAKFIQKPKSFTSLHHLHKTNACYLFEWRGLCREIMMFHMMFVLFCILSLLLSCQSLLLRTCSSKIKHRTHLSAVNEVPTPIDQEKPLRILLIVEPTPFGYVSGNNFQMMYIPV